MSIRPIRFVVLCVACCLLAAGLALSQTTTKSTTKKATPANKPTTTSARKGRATKGRTSTAAAPVARYRQAAPTPDRYKEIQQALVDKGYLKSEPNGVWDNDSADALKQFQTDKNLPPTGKITAASLIGLGLGPKNEGNIAAAAGAPAASPEPAAPAPPAPATAPSPAPAN